MEEWTFWKKCSLFIKAWDVFSLSTYFHTPCTLFHVSDCGFLVIVPNQCFIKNREDQDIAGYIILRWILERQDGVVYTGLI
jgi:hypothetical protein